MNSAIVAAAVGGFLAWMLGRVAASIVLRYRLSAYLTTMLNIHFAGLRDHQSWLQQMIQTSVQPGRMVAGAPFYTKSDLTEFSSIQEHYLQLLFKSELKKLTKCTKCLWEIEILYDGFCRSLLEAQNARVPLDKDRVEFFRRRAQRINSYISCLPTALASLRDLPDDYSGKISATALIIPAEEPKTGAAGPSTPKSK